MFRTPSKSQTIKPARKLIHGLAFIAGAVVLAGTVAVSAQTSSASETRAAPAVLASYAAAPRPLTVGLRGAQPARKIRVIQIYNVSADQKKFGG